MPNAKTVLIEQIEQILAPALTEAGMEMVDVEFVHEHGQWVLRFFLDKTGGITLDDCAQMSDRIGRILDAADLIKQSYSLEVSSPGIYRPLKKEADFAKFRGERVDVTLYAPLNGRRHFRGTIDSVETGLVRVDSDGDKFALPIADVAKARLDPEIKI